MAAFVTAIFAIILLLNEQKVPEKHWPLWAAAALLTIVVYTAVVGAPK